MGRQALRLLGVLVSPQTPCEGFEPKSCPGELAGSCSYPLPGIPVLAHQRSWMWDRFAEVGAEQFREWLICCSHYLSFP